MINMIHCVTFLIMFLRFTDASSIVRLEQYSFKIFQDVNTRSHLTCFTCEKSRSNEECNRKAIDETCEQKLAASEHLRESSLAPNGRNYSCMTVHKFDAQNTISIEKKCSTDCRPDMIGCFVETVKRLGAIQQIQTCTYCCNANYCNMNSVMSQEEANKFARTLLESNSAIRQRSVLKIENWFLFILLIIFAI